MSIIELLAYLEDLTLQWLVSLGLTAHTAIFLTVLYEGYLLLLTPIAVLYSYVGYDVYLLEATKRRCGKS